MDKMKSLHLRLELKNIRQNKISCWYFFILSIKKTLNIIVDMETMASAHPEIFCFYKHTFTKT